VIKLAGRAKWLGGDAPIRRAVWRVCRPDEIPCDLPLACLMAEGQPALPGHQLYLTTDADVRPPGPALLLPPDLSHLTAGDLITVSADGAKIAVLWKSTATHNSLLLTEQCDNYCLMCSQPPKERDDSWLFERARQIVSLLPPTARSLGLTGGEPTLHADALIGLIEHCRDVAPWLELHLLSNGRRFADPSFSARYADVRYPDIMVGIPVYAPEPGLHDFIVQAPGAFEETVRGVLNLASLRQRVEIRVVIQRHNVSILRDLAIFITRNLPFVDQVALMGLEMTGLARPNFADVWAEPADYQHELLEATQILVNAKIATKIYNHQLCVLSKALWPYAVRSISDWKNDYLEMCHGCGVRDSCGGVFTTSGQRLSAHLRPLATVSHEAVGSGSALG
jgi:His-Xaa-Ser system radical SAM maturase HxsC